MHQLKNTSQIFKILFLTEDTYNIFVLCYIGSILPFKTKSSFSSENKKSTVESERHLCKEAIKV